MQTRRNNINTHLFATALAAWLGLLIVGVPPAQANAKTLVRIEVVKAHSSATNFDEDFSLSTKEEADIAKRLPLHRLVSTFQNFINDFTLRVGQSQPSNGLAIGFYSLPSAQNFEPQFAGSPTKYPSQKVSTSNNHVLVVTNLARASL